MTPRVDEARLAGLFRDLVGVYSPSGKEEAALGFLEEFLARHGCPYGVQPVDEDRYNLILGRPDAPLVFVGHVDTVDAWDLEDIGPQDLPGGWVRGLGAADMKGGCAAMIEAYLTLRAAGRGRDVGLALLVGEEHEGDGAEALLREARPGRALVGEPTGLQLCTGHFGYLEVVLSATGRRVHASIPQHGENAAEAVLEVLHGLLRDPELRADGGPVLSIRHLETSNPGFAVPARADAWVDVHVPPGWPTERVRRAVARVTADRGQGRVSVEHPFCHEGFRVAGDDPVVRAYQALGGGGLGVFPSHSDANVFHAAGVPSLVLGPGALEYAHTADEQVELDEVVRAARLYAELAASLGRDG